MTIPFLNFDPLHSKLREEMMSSFARVYDSNWFVMGKHVETFEEEYAQFNKTKHAIGVSNGLDALYLILKGLGIKEGDEVIVPSNTFIATVLAVSYLGATPVFVEPDINSYNIDVSKIERVINSRTKVIMPVHLYGQACNLDVIEEIAKKYNLYIVEDNAQAHGSIFNGRITGSVGIANGTSFYPGKNLGALGDGGGITSNDDELSDKIRILRNYGSSRKYVHDVIGHNMRLDEMQAAFLSVKLRYLTDSTYERQNIARMYDEGLKNNSIIITPQIAEGASHVYHLYVIRTNHRDELQIHLKNKGVATLIHYPIPPHLQSAYTDLGFGQGDFPIAEELANTSLSIPIWPGMKKEEVKYVIDAINDFSA